MKKLLAAVLTLSMLAGMLSGCGQKGGTQTQEPAAQAQNQAPAAAEVKTYNVGVSIYKYDDNFMTLYRNEIAAYFKTLETDTVKYNVNIQDAKNDMAEQTNQVDSFLAQGVDVLIINLVQSSSEASITEKAKAANVPVVFINREPMEAGAMAWDKVCYVGADARQSGTYQGEIVANLPDKGDVNGDGTVKYVMIMGDPENVDAQYRTEFSIKALTDAGIKVEELFKQRGDWDQAKGQELAASALAQFGNDIDVIFCNNDGMALGAAQAISAAGRTVGKDIYLLGVDALDEVVEMVNAGKMTGTVLNDHIGQSHTAVDCAVKYINGQSNDQRIYVDYQKVTSAAEASAPKPAAAEPKTYNVGVSIYKYDDNFMTLYRNEIAAYFKSLETDTVKYNVNIQDGKNDMAEQTNQVDSFLAQGVDVLVINLVQSSSEATITEKAKAANVPVVYINREPMEAGAMDWDKVCYVGADARQSGTYQGEIVANLPDKGDANGDGVVSYVMIMGDPENVDAQYRTEFSIKALTDAGIKVEELFKQRGDWDQAKGQELAASALAQFGDKIDVIFCNNDGMALGAAQAISAAGRTVGKDIYLLGVDALDEVVEMVKAGTMTGTVLNDHIGQSHTAVDCAIKYINGQNNDQRIYVDYQKVSA